MSTATIRRGRLPGPHTIPIVIECADGIAARSIVDIDMPTIREMLADAGALLLRGFNVDTASFSTFFDGVCGARIEYRYRSTPRKSVADRVYTSTQYPADREIPLHCENSYHLDWPMYIALFSKKAASTGGETPIADVARVTARIPAAILDRFRARGVRYVRNYHAGVDLPWSDVFQTQDKSEVERMCGEAGLTCEWISNDHLRTSQRCQGTARHPRLGTEVFFNQAHLFHVSSLGDALAETMIDLYGEENLPRNAFYGDGEPLEPQTLDAVRKAFAAESIAFPWRDGDVMLLDNMRMAHGRRAYAGDRSVLVAMGEPHSALARTRAA